MGETNLAQYICLPLGELSLKIILKYYFKKKVTIMLIISILLRQIAAVPMEMNSWVLHDIKYKEITTIHPPPFLPRLHFSPNNLFFLQFLRLLQLFFQRLMMKVIQAVFLRRQPSTYEVPVDLSLHLCMSQLAIFHDLHVSIFWWVMQQRTHVKLRWIRLICCHLI